MATTLVEGTETRFPVMIADSETILFENLADDLDIDPVDFAKSFRPLESRQLVGDVRAVIIDVVNRRNLGKVEVNYIFPITVANERGNFVDGNYVSLLPIVMFGRQLIAEPDLPIYIQSVKMTGFALKSPQTVRIGVTYRMDISEYRMNVADL